MFEAGVAISIIGWMIALFFGPITLLIIRIIYVIKNKITGKKFIYIVFMPISFGFYHKAHNGNIKVIYTWFVILFFICSIAGSVIIFYMHL